MKRYTAFLYPALIALIGLFNAPEAMAGKIEGTVTFRGNSDGVHPIEMTAHLALGQEPVASNDTPSPGGSYHLDVPGGTYYIGAFLDWSGDGGPPRPEEPQAWYDSNGDGKPDTVTVSGGATVSNVNVELGFVYVDIDATGTNDGTSWANAFNDVNAGIQAANSGVEVWVAEGTYTPGTLRTSRFALKNGVSVYGGFAGNEINRLQRNPAARETILSGEIGTLLLTDNVYNVVWANATNETALIDGFTITRGQADGVPPFDRGGGLYAYFGVATVVNVTFYLNRASQAGGGAATNGGVVHMVNSRFFTNYAGLTTGTGVGGGFYGTTNGERLVNCLFTGNQASLRGGAIYMAPGSFGGNLTNLTVYGNFSSFEAQGIFIHNTGTSRTTITNSIVWGNSPQQILTWGEVRVRNSLVQDGVVGGMNIITDDPQFVDVSGQDNAVGTPDDNLRLLGNSPAIDAGNNNFVPPDVADIDGDRDTSERVPLDLSFNKRFVNSPTVVDTGTGSPPLVDIGAYEWRPGPLILKDGFEGS